MKMAKSNKRLLAVLLSVLMVISIIPAAAIGASAASTNYGTITSGQSVNVTYAKEAGYYTLSSVPVYTTINGASTVTNKHYAIMSVEGIEDVYACDFDLGDTAAGILQSSSVSVYPTLEATYNTTTLMNEINTKLKAKAAENSGDDYFTVRYLNATQKNKLTKASFYYSGSEAYKTVYLYAKVTPYTYTYNSDSYYTSGVAGTSYYERIGSVTLYSAYRSSFDLQLSETYGTIAAGQTVSLIATVPGAINVKYEAVPSSVSGISYIDQVQSGVFMITANSLVTSNNKILIYAYQMNATGENAEYVYRSTSGATTPSATKPTSSNSYVTVGNEKYYAVFDYATVTYSTTSPITGITFSKYSYACEVGDSFYATATAYPTGATGSISYTSSNPAIADVTSYGLVTGKGVGTATIYATATDGSGASAAAIVTVSAMTAKLYLDKSTVNVEVGATNTITASVLPTTLSSKNVVWSSSNNAVATVSGGVVKGVKVGTAIVTATYYTAAGVAKTATCTVNVKEKAAKITVDATMDLEVGESENLDATIANTTNKTLLYVSDNTSVAKVDANGKVTGLKAGSAMITVVSAEDADVKAYCVVTVTKEEVEQTEGIIEKDAEYKKGSKYYWTESVSSAEVKAAIAELKGADLINVIVDVDSDSNSNKTILTRYAVSRLSKYADSLTIKVEDKTFTFDSIDLEKMANGRPVYIYTVGSKVSVQYKNAAGKYVKFTGITVEKN